MSCVNCPETFDRFCLARQNGTEPESGQPMQVANSRASDYPICSHSCRPRYMPSGDFNLDDSLHRVLIAKCTENFTSIGDGMLAIKTPTSAIRTPWEPTIPTQILKSIVTLVLSANSHGKFPQYRAVHNLISSNSLMTLVSFAFKRYFLARIATSLGPSSNVCPKKSHVTY